MSSAAQATERDAARLFSIPAAVCVFVALASLIFNGYLLRPAAQAKADAARMFTLAQGIADTAQLFPAARVSPEDVVEADAAGARLGSLLGVAKNLASISPGVTEALRRASLDASASDAHARARLLLNTATAQRLLVRRGQEMFATAEQQSAGASQLHLAAVILALGISLAGLRWGAELYAGLRAQLPTSLAIDSLGRTLMAASSESVCVTDRDGVIREVNGAFLRLAGYASEEVIGKDLDFNLAPRPGENTAGTASMALLQEGSWSGEMWRRQKSGAAYVEHTSRALLRDVSGVVTGVVSIARDLGASRDAQRLLLWQANHDQLTKLPNRGLFLDRLGGMVTRMDERGALLMLDIDRFKNVNERFGYVAGDQLLTQVAHRIALNVRDRDTVARLGGDKFGVLLAAPLRDGEAERVARALLEKIREPLLVDGRDVLLGASIGITLFPDDGTKVSTLVQQAERALAEAKQRGRNAYRFYEGAMNEAAARRAELEHALATAVAQGQLRMVYQPIIDVRQQQVYGVEALLRWQHPKLGPISPAEFIPVAEECGLMEAIGLWVCDAVQEQLAQWQRMGLDDLRVALNVSGRQLRTRAHRDELARRVTGRFAKQLTVEITESVLLDGGDGIGDFLRQVRAAGVQVALDDFGTGYSSLSYLLRFPIDVVKIDKSFVDQMEDDNKALQLVATIVSMGRILGMRVVAEGVETQGQVEKLTLCGGELIQGYYFARPMQAEDVLRFVRGDIAEGNADRDLRQAS